MAGHGPAPSSPDQRRRANAPERGEWKSAPGHGWQHGEVPKPPAKLLRASRDAWATWFDSWFAAFWGPEHVPALRQVIRIYDQVERGEYQRHNELRLAMEAFGMTPKGQQDRRWQPPAGEAMPSSPTGVPQEQLASVRRLRAVDPAG